LIQFERDKPVKKRFVAYITKSQPQYLQHLSQTPHHAIKLYNPLTDFSLFLSFSFSIYFLSERAIATSTNYLPRNTNHHDTAKLL